MTRIRSVLPLDGFHVKLTFTDGSEREVDLGPENVRIISAWKANRRQRYSYERSRR